jgi:hypothetical protein
VDALGTVWDILIVAVVVCAALNFFIAMFLPKEQRSIILREIVRKLNL